MMREGRRLTYRGAAFLALAALLPFPARAQEPAALQGTVTPQPVSGNPDLWLSPEELRMPPVPAPIAQARTGGARSSAAAAPVTHRLAPVRTRFGPPMVPAVRPASIGPLPEDLVTKYPYRAIGRLETRWGTEWRVGTAFLVGPYHLLTAGHCVYSAERGGWADEVIFTPGLSGAYKPYNSYHSTMLGTNSAWIDRASYDDDWGFVWLDRNIGNAVGTFGMWWFPLDEYANKLVSFSGYPADLGQGLHQYRDLDCVTSATDTIVYYNLDSYAGMSGSPVFDFMPTGLPDPAARAWAVNAHGDDSRGDGPRLSDSRISMINDWKDDQPVPTDYADLLDDGASAAGFQPQTVHPGSGFSAWCRVRNADTAAAGSFQVSFRVSTDTQITGADPEIATITVSSLAPFTTGAVNLDVTFPSIAPGQYYVGWLVDSANQVAESNESNNVACLSSPLLTVTANHAPDGPTVSLSPAAPNSTQAVTATVTAASDPDGDALTYKYGWWLWQGGQWANKQYRETADTSDTLPAGTTTKGQSWCCLVEATDGIATSPAVQKRFAVGNAAPSEPALTLSPAAPTSVQDVRASVSGAADPDGDALQYRYSWLLAVGRQWVLRRTRTTPLHSDVLAASLTVKGQLWRCVVRANDGTANSTAVEERFIVGNALPSLPTLTLDPHAPTYRQNVRASISGAVDPDGDPIVYWINWSVAVGRQWVQRRGRITSQAYDVLPASMTTAGQTWKCSVIATDETSPAVQPDRARAVEVRFTIGTGAPSTPTLTLTPQMPCVGHDVTAKASGCVDPDGDAIRYTFGWFQAVGRQWVQQRGRITDDPSDALPASMTRVGQTWKCCLVASDGTNRTAVVERRFTVGTGTPTTPHLALDPATPDASDDVTARVSGCTDPDGGRITYTYGWFVASGREWVLRRGRITAQTYDVLPAGLTSVGQAWKCRVVASDGVNQTPAVETRFTIGAGTAGVATAMVTSLAAMPTAAGAELVLTLAAPAEVRAEVLNIAGRPVRLIANGRPMPAGTQRLVWTGQSDAGLPVPNGPYLIRVTVRGEDGTASEALRTVAVRR